MTWQLVGASKSLPSNALLLALIISISFSALWRVEAEGFPSYKI